jgi:hypothetical protein
MSEEEQRERQKRIIRDKTKECSRKENEQCLGINTCIRLKYETKD